MQRQFIPPLVSILCISLLVLTVKAQTFVAQGEQPRITVDGKGIVRLIYGEKDKIFFASSTNQGASFSEPMVIAEIPGMHLGMTRGPQLATSSGQSLVSAMDKHGNIHSFLLDHRSNEWKKIKQANDVDGSAPEGLMSLAADDKNNFYAVWLDLRNERRNNICFSVLRNGQWSANKFVYVSPDTHVCECCKPSVAVKNKMVSIMFRNWLRGSRDLYLTVSKDGGNSFSSAEKLGTGTWVLKGCPMDGGGLFIDAQNSVRTVWQRDGVVFSAQPGKAEQRVASGRHVAMHGDLMTWQQDDEIFIAKFNGGPLKLADGTAADAAKWKDQSIIAVWEQDHRILSKTIDAQDLDGSYKDNQTVND